jgi:hypothetical protein
MRNVGAGIWAFFRFLANGILYPFGGTLPGRTHGGTFIGRRRKPRMIDLRRRR